MVSFFYTTCTLGRVQCGSESDMLIRVSSLANQKASSCNLAINYHQWKQHQQSVKGTNPYMYQQTRFHSKILYM